MSLFITPHHPHLVNRAAQEWNIIEVFVILTYKQKCAS